MITNLIDTMITNLHSLFTFHQLPTNVLLLHDPVQDSSLHLVIMFLYFPWIFDGSLFFPCLSCPWHFRSWLAYDFVEYPSVWVFWCFLITRLKLGFFFFANVTEVMFCHFQCLVLRDSWCWHDFFWCCDLNFDHLVKVFSARFVYHKVLWLFCH